MEKLLLATDRDIVDSMDFGGRTPLSRAAEYGYEEAVKLKLGKDGVNPNAMDKDGRTPLSWAAGGMSWEERKAKDKSKRRRNVPPAEKLRRNVPVSRKAEGECPEQVHCPQCRFKLQMGLFSATGCPFGLEKEPGGNS